MLYVFNFSLTPIISHLTLNIYFCFLASILCPHSSYIINTKIQCIQIAFLYQFSFCSYHLSLNSSIYPLINFQTILIIQQYNLFQTIKFIFHTLAQHLCNMSLIFHSHHLFSIIPHLALNKLLLKPFSPAFQ